MTDGSLGSWDELIAQKIRLIQRADRYRRRSSVISAAHQWLNFSSNDYLGLANEPALKKSYQAGFECYPCGSGASQVISGYHATHEALENAFSEALGTDDALLFSSGYAANLAIVKMLASLDAHLLIDKQNHASIYDGLALAQAHFSRYPHLNMPRLQTLLKGNLKRPILLTEGIFSMSGQVAPLKTILDIANASCQMLPCIVDEAHSFGVAGPHGLGVVAACGLSQEEIPLRVIPFGKALAGQGAVVVGRKDWIDLLLQEGRSTIYSTAISPAMAHGLRMALQLSIEADDKRQKLSQLVDYFQRTANASSFTWRASSTPIQQLQLGCPILAQHYADMLFNEGILCRAVRQPTVTLPEIGLRVVLNACHQFADIDYLFSRLSIIDARVGR